MFIPQAHFQINVQVYLNAKKADATFEFNLVHYSFNRTDKLLKFQKNLHILP
jgi:hypothetical protein